MRTCLAVLVLVWGTAPRAEAASLTLRGLGIDEDLSGEATTAEALNQALLRGSDLPVYARISLGPSDLEGEAEDRFGRLDERLERYGTKGVPVLIVLPPALPRPEAAEPWRLLLRGLAERYRGRVKAYQLPVTAPGVSARDTAFVLKLGAVQVRAADPDALVIVGPLHAGDEAWLRELYAEEIAAYVDGVAVAGEGEAAAAIAAVEPVVEVADPDALLMVAGRPLPSDPGQAARALLGWQLAQLGGRVSITTYVAEPSALPTALNAAARIKDVLTADLVRLEDQTVGLRLTQAGHDVTVDVPHRLLYDLADLTTYLAYGPGAGGGAPLGVQLSDATGAKATLRDPITGKVDANRRNDWDGQARLARVVAPLVDRPLLLQFSYGSETARVGRADVRGSVLPPVAEIVFRHQQVQAAQDERLRNYLAQVRMESHFRPSASDPGFDVVTENRFYFDRQGSEWEETTFLLNGTRWGPKRPPFPLLQPEKVLSLPLDLRLSKDYRYRLQGVDKVEGRDAYAVRFDPLDEARSLYSGTVWIDTESFAKAKVQAVQTRLSAPVVSSEEVQFFTREGEVDGTPIHLLSRFTTRQIMLIAGRNLLVERLVRFSGFAINSADFEERRVASRAGDNVMYRDTEAGLRYLVKRGGIRVVDDRATTSAKAFAVGTIIDPSYDYPLPILGLNYLDFAFLGRDNQLALLFGGILVLANVQRPQAVGHLSASLDLFAIAVSSNDQVFDAEGERRDERLRALPFSTGLNLGWQFKSFHKLSASYQFRYDAYSRADETGEDFVPPADTVTNGFALGYEWRRGGYTLQAAGSYYRRGTWRPWGDPGDYDPANRTYEKYSASVSKDLFFGGLHKIHLNAGYFGGRRLDRFSQYQFGLFEDNRIHGVPSSGVRFSELAMLRTGYSFNLLDTYGLDLFLDEALGRQPGLTDWSSITGLGLGFNLRGPRGTLLRGELGKSFLPSAYRGSGSFVAQITVLKPI